MRLELDHGAQRMGLCTQKRLLERLLSQSLRMLNGFFPLAAAGGYGGQDVSM